MWALTQTSPSVRACPLGIGQVVTRASEEFDDGCKSKWIFGPILMLDGLPASLVQKLCGRLVADVQLQLRLRMWLKFVL